MKDKPDRVEPGQRWRDLDERSRTEEFTVVAVVTDGRITYRKGEDPDEELAELVEDLIPRVVGPDERDYAVVERVGRVGSGRVAAFHRVIRVERLLAHDNDGYEYLGMDR